VSGVRAVEKKPQALSGKCGFQGAAPIILQRVKMNKVDIRRAVIREWMALPNDQRLNEEQAASFATAVMQRYELPPSNRPPHDVIKGWLLGRKAKAA
jgi:hypothetical protein